MAGFGWFSASGGPGIEVGIGSVTASRATDGGGDTYASIRGAVGRKRGKRYFEIDATSTGVAVGFVSISADLDGQLGGGTTASQWGLLLSNGYFYYRDISEAAAFDTGLGEMPPSIIGVLLDFDDHIVTFYSDGEVIFSRAIEIADGTALYPAAHLNVGATGVELTTIAPFSYPPELTFVDWDKSDSAIGSRVSGIVQVEGSPVSRLVKAFSYDRLAYAINNKVVMSSKPLGQTLSNPSTGEYEIILTDGYSGSVIVFAFDSYGGSFEASSSVSVNDRVHPTIPTGYVYECTGGGTLPAVEPDPWPVELGVSHSIGTASFEVKPFYKPEAHGPVTPEFVEVDVNQDIFKPTMAAASNHTLLVCADTSVVSFGRNASGKISTPAGLDSVTTVAAGGEFSVAVKLDGTIVHWGDTAYGKGTPPAGISDFVAIAAGSNHIVALRSTGVPVAYGLSSSSQTSVGGLTNVRQVAANNNYTICVKSDGTLYAVGSNTNSVVSGASGQTNIKQVACGYTHVVALKSDGTVVCWGNTANGRTTVPAGLDGVIQVAAGFAHSYALKSDGTLVSWGDNSKGQRNTPAGLNGSAALVACGDEFTVGMDASGNTYGWGYNNYGQTTMPPQIGLLPQYAEL